MIVSAINIYYMINTVWELEYLDKYGRRLLLSLLGRHMNKLYSMQSHSGIVNYNMLNKVYFGSKHDGGNGNRILSQSCEKSISITMHRRV